MNSPLLRYETKSVQDLAKKATLGRLYAVLDPCGSERILEKVLALGWERCRCLFGRSLLADYWAVAPYLVKADLNLLEWLVTNVWDEPWGILIVTQSNVGALYAHLQQLLRIQDASGEIFYFRFYDPRVLGAFLSTCRGGQLEEFYGPAALFGIKGIHAGHWQMLSRASW